MRLVGLVVAALMLLFGFRLLTVAGQAAFKSRVMVREGIRWKWHTVPANEAWQRALRDGLMGVLLIVLAVVMII
jgi:hypothetical protein